MRKSRLELVITDLMVPRMTLRALTAATNKRNCNPITHVPLADVLTNSLYYACQFMTRYVRQFYVRVISLPAVPVTQTDTACHDFEYHAIAARNWIRDLFNFGPCCKGPVYDGFHCNCSD